MRVEKADPQAAKGWYLGPWNSALDAAVGYANTAIDEPHRHRRTTEVYLVARGEAEVRVEQQTVRLKVGEVLVVEPGEAHTLVGCSSDYFHFVLHLPGLPAEEARADKVLVPRDQLGLP
jgi:mannose-6-phosphate isomerase-like protein (cupin superfamily)